MEPVSANSTERQSVVWLTDRVRRSACDWDRRMLRAARRTVPCRSARYCPHLRQASGASAGCVISSIVEYPARRDGEMPDEHTDAWSQTIALLDRVAARQMSDEATRITLGHRAKTTWNDHATLIVRVVDRTSSRTVTVSWCDPLSGYFGHQSWRASLAKRSGNCVLSGDPIRRGDLVYQPSSRPSRPGNAGAMIIASRIDAALHGKPPAAQP
jgi:hypothetical protein